MSNSALVSSIGPIYTTFWSNENGSQKTSLLKVNMYHKGQKKLKNFEKILGWIKLVTKKPTGIGVWLDFSIFLAFMAHIGLQKAYPLYSHPLLIKK